MGDARVVARGQPRGAQPAGQREHRVEPHQAVAAHTGVGGLPGGIGVQEVVDDRGPELVAQVQREVGQAHAVGRRPRPGHGLGRAAAALPVGAGIRPQLERHGQHVPAGVQGQLRGGGTVHPAAHGHQRATRVRVEAHRAVTCGQSQRPVQGIGGQLGGVGGGGRQAPQLGGDRGRGHRGRIEQRLPLQPSSTTALPAARAAAHPQRLEPGLDDPVAPHAHGYPHHIAAGSAAGRAGVRRPGQRAEATRVLGVIAQG